MTDYYHKYIKYKSKYHNLCEQQGGCQMPDLRKIPFYANYIAQISLVDQMSKFPQSENSRHKDYRYQYYDYMARVPENERDYYSQRFRFDPHWYPTLKYRDIGWQKFIDCAFRYISIYTIQFEEIFKDAYKHNKKILLIDGMNLVYNKQFLYGIYGFLSQKLKSLTNELLYRNEFRLRIEYIKEIYVYLFSTIMGLDNYTVIITYHSNRDEFTDEIYSNKNRVIYLGIPCIESANNMVHCRIYDAIIDEVKDKNESDDLILTYLWFYYTQLMVEENNIYTTSKQNFRQQLSQLMRQFTTLAVTIKSIRQQYNEIIKKHDAALNAVGEYLDHESNNEQLKLLSNDRKTNEDELSSLKSKINSFENDLINLDDQFGKYLDTLNQFRDKQSNDAFNKIQILTEQIDIKKKELNMIEQAIGNEEAALEIINQQYNSTKNENTNVYLARKQAVQQSINNMTDEYHQKYDYSTKINDKYKKLFDEDIKHSTIDKKFYADQNLIIRTTVPAIQNLGNKLIKYRTIDAIIIAHFFRI